MAWTTAEPPASSAFGATGVPGVPEAVKKCSAYPQLHAPRLRRGGRGRRHGNDHCLFLQVIEHDGSLTGRVADNAGVGCIDPHLASARLPHPRRGLCRRRTPSRLRLGGAIRTRRRGGRYGRFLHGAIVYHDAFSNHEKAIAIRNAPPTQPTPNVAKQCANEASL